MWFLLAESATASDWSDWGPSGAVLAAMTAAIGMLWKQLTGLEESRRSEREEMRKEWVESREKAEELSRAERKELLEQYTRETELARSETRRSNDRMVAVVEELGKSIETLTIMDRVEALKRLNERKQNQANQQMPSND